MTKPKPYSPIASPNEALDQCARCDWYRVYPTPDRAHHTINHPRYGAVTLHTAARLDSENHNCTEHTQALTRIRAALAFKD